jgi:hypothetical protein
MALDGGGACQANLDDDPANCGWCNHACGAGSACDGGSCAAAEIWPASPTGLAYDQGNLFGTGVSSNSVLAWSLASSSATKIAPPQNSATSLQVVPPYVYWTTADGVIHKVLEDGGALTQVGVGANAHCLSVNSTRVYWWTAGGVHSLPADGDGSVPATNDYPVGPGVTGCVNADDQELFIVTGSVLLQRALDSGVSPQIVNLPYPAEVDFLPLAGANAVFFTDSFADAGADAAVDAGAVTMHLEVVPQGTNAHSEIASFPYDKILAMAADDAGVYWSSEAGARVDGCQDLGCTGGVHHYSPAAPGYTIGSLALDATYIYFTMSGTNAGVFRVAR